MAQDRQEIEKKLNSDAKSYYKALADYVINRSDPRDAAAALAAVVLSLPDETRDLYEAALVRLTPAIDP